MMIEITINNKQYSFEKGTSLLKAIESTGVNVPSLCYYEGIEHFTSCMLCLVKDAHSGRLFPSCSHQVAEGMEIITDDEEIFDARKTGLELLLSEHAGDCEAPCTLACPANMNIPLMNRLLEKGEMDHALAVVRKDIALPSVLGRICPAPCEGACKRKPVDEAVSVCLLKRYAGDYGTVTLPAKPIQQDKKVAVIGAGPAGLAAAYYLQMEGIPCDVFDKNKLPGGNLQYAINDELLPKDVLNREIQYIRDTGVQFFQNTGIDQEQFDKLSREYQAVVLATGDYYEEIGQWGIDNNNKQVQIDKSTFQTNHKHVFAVGNVTRSSRLAIRSLGQGKDAARSVLQFLNGEPVSGKRKKFNSKLGKLIEDEFSEYLKEATDFKRFTPKKGIQNGFSLREMVNEASRCMHCDCRKIDHCKLRDFSDDYDAKQKRFDYSERKSLKKYIQEEVVLYEPGKCIKCGICVRLTARYKEQYGLTFIGRGFDVEVQVPFNKDLKTGLAKTAGIVAEACPTGALSKM